MSLSVRDSSHHQHLTPDAVVGQLRRVSAAPRVLPRLKQLLNDVDSSMPEVVALIQIDPGIATHVLHMGNSAYYSQGSQCFTVEDAVCRVGYNQVYQLVAHAVTSQIIVRPLSIYGIEADGLWRRSLTCALGAEVLAQGGGIDSDIAYTLGLLHGVGMVALDAWASEHSPELRLCSRGFPHEACDAEIAQFGFHQAEAGAALLRMWNFPYGVCEAIRWQYMPGATAAHFHLACLLYVAKWLHAAIDCAGDGLPSPIDPRLLEPLSLDAERLVALVPEVRGRLASIVSLLNTGSTENEIARLSGS